MDCFGTSAFDFGFKDHFFCRQQCAKSSNFVHTANKTFNICSTENEYTKNEYTVYIIHI